MDGFVWVARENLYTVVRTRCLLLIDTRKWLLFRYNIVTLEESIFIFSSLSNQYFSWLSEAGEWIRDQLVTGHLYNTTSELFFPVSLVPVWHLPLIKEMSDFACSIDQNKLPAANLWTSQKCLWHGELCSVVQVIGLSGNVIGYYAVSLIEYGPVSWKWTKSFRLQLPRSRENWIRRK